MVAPKNIMFMPTPGVNFINVKRTNFYEFLHTNVVLQLLLRTFNIHVTREKLPKRRSYEKFVCLMLMKLTFGSSIPWLDLMGLGYFGTKIEADLSLIST